MSIFVESDVNRAVENLRPSIKELLESPGAIWGPRYLAIATILPGFNPNLPLMHTFGEPEPWKEEWGKVISYREFRAIAESKARVSYREQRPTRDIVEKAPWLLQAGEYLYGGGVYEEGIAVGVSGATDLVDEEVGWMVLNALITIGLLRAKHMKETKQERISA